MAAIAKQDDRDLRAELNEIVANCQSKHGDFDNATKALLKVVRKDAALYEEMFVSHEWAVAKEMISGAARHKRKTIWRHHDEAARSASDGRVVALVRSNVSALLDFPLPGGLPLGSASKLAVSEASEFFNRQASDMSEKGTWLGKIAAKLPEGKTVFEAFSEADLEKLREE